MKQCDSRHTRNPSFALQVVGAVSRAIHSKDDSPVDDYIREGVEALEDFELELAKRGTTFFGGKFQFRAVGGYCCFLDCLMALSWL
jgi:hypothetical protein